MTKPTITVTKAVIAAIASGAILGASKLALGHSARDPGAPEQPSISAPPLTTADLEALRRAIDAQGQHIEGVTSSLHAVDKRLTHIEGYMEAQQEARRDAAMAGRK